MTPANNADLCEWVVFFFPFPTLDNRSFFSFPIEPGLDSEARRPHRDSLPQTSNNFCVGELYQTACAHVFPSLGERTSGAGVKSVELYCFLYGSLSLTKAG